MAFAISAPRSAWRALLWKDFQQVKPALLVVTLALMGIQAFLLLIVPWLSPPDAQIIIPLDVPIAIASFAPFICMLASIGMLIGQERQTGSWAWSNSLPQSWRQALASKTVVSLAASLLPLIPLSLIPWIGWSVGYHLENDSAALPTAAFAILIAIDLAVYLAIGVLIFREPLTGLVVGSIVFFFGQYLLLACVWVPLEMLGYSHFYNSEPRVDRLFFGFFSIVFVVASIAMTWLFRWRWTYGMTAALPRFRFPALTSWSGASISEASRGFYQRAPRGEFRMLLAQSIQSTWGWLLLSLGGSFLMAFAWFEAWNEMAGRWNAQDLPWLLTCVQVAIAAFWGIASFATEQTAGRFRFMADRGASPTKLVTAKILPAVLAMLVFPLLSLLFVILFVIQVSVRSPVPGMVLQSLMAAVTGYLIGALSSLCFRSSVMSLAVNLISIVCLFLLSSAVMSFGFLSTDVKPWWFQTIACWVIPVAVSLGFVTLYWLVRKWLVQDSPRLERYYAWMFPALALLPVLVPTAFGFLLLPNVPWQGHTHIASLKKLSPDVWPELRELKLFELPPGLDNPYGLHRRIDLSAVKETNQLDHFVHAFFAQQLPAWQQPDGPEKFAAELAQLEPIPTQTRPQVDLAANYQRKRLYYDRIYATALMGDFLAEQGRIDLAKLAWASNKQLLDTAMRLEPYTEDLGAWVFSSLVMDHMLANLNAEQRAQWGSDEEIREQFRGDLEVMREKTLNGLRRFAALHRQELRLRWGEGSQLGTYSWITRAIPTLRWRQERSLAIELDSAIAIVSGQTANDANYGVFAQIVEYWNALQTAQYASISRNNSFDPAEGMQDFDQENEFLEYEDSEGLQGMGQLDGLPEEPEMSPEN